MLETIHNISNIIVTITFFATSSIIINAPAWFAAKAAHHSSKERTLKIPAILANPLIFWPAIGIFAFFTISCTAAGIYYTQLPILHRALLYTFAVITLLFSYVLTFGHTWLKTVQREAQVKKYEQAKEAHYFEEWYNQTHR